MLEVSRTDSRERNSPKDQSKTGKSSLKDFATRQGLEQSTLKRSASHGGSDGPSEKVEAKYVGESSDANKDRIIDAGSRQSPESSQRRAVSSRTEELYLNAIKGSRGFQGRLVWVDEGSFSVHRPGLWEGSKLKQVCFDRAVAGWGEIVKGHPERIWDRVTGNIPNKELYRFLKRAGLKPGTYIDLGAGAGNFIRHALGKLIGWDKPDLKIYAVERDDAAIKLLRDNVDNLAKEESQSEGKVEIIKADYTRGKYLDNFKKNNNISDISGILWANNGHYYGPNERKELMRQMKSMLKEDGKLLIVEYHTFKQHGPDGMYNKYPLSKKQLKVELEEVGFEDVKFPKKLPSRDQGMMYSAVATARKRSEDKDVS